MHHPTVDPQSAPPHSHAHNNHSSAPTNSNETRRHRDSNELQNAMNMAKYFQNKDSKYSEADNEIIMDFIMQYNLSHHEKRQYVHDLFRGVALRYYYAAVEPLGNSYADVIAEMQSLFNTISKQQCVKAELSGSSFQDMVDKSDDDRRTILRDLVATIEARLPLYPRDLRNNSSKVEFFRYELLIEDWTREGMYSIGNGTKFRELQTQLASAPQIHEKYWQVEGTVAKPVPQPRLDRSLQYSSQGRSKLKE